MARRKVDTAPLEDRPNIRFSEHVESSARGGGAAAEEGGAAAGQGGEGEGGE